MAEDYTQRLPYLMRSVTQVLSGQLERTLRPLGLTHAQLSALAQLGTTPTRGRSGAALARRAGVTAQSMSTAIASLLQRGLVARAPHPTLGTALEARITADGVELLARAQAAALTVEAQALADLSEQQRVQLKALLHQMIRTLGIDAVDQPGE